MKLELITPCHAALNQDGLLSLLGVFDTVHAAALPVALPRLIVAGRVRLWSDETGARPGRLSLTDADGVHVTPPIDFTAQIQVFDRQTWDAAVDAVCTSLTFTHEFPGVVFSRFGEYSLEFALNGEVLGTCPLFILPMHRLIPATTPDADGEVAA